MSTALSSTSDATNRYTPNTSVMTALRTPRILIKEFLPGLVVAFARRVGHLVTVTRTLPEEKSVPTGLHTVNSALFLASSNNLTTQFEFINDPDRI